MNELTIFNNEQFGQLRTVMIDDEPWFVGKDVCEMFGDKNSNRSLGRIDNIDRRMANIQTNGGMQNVVVINESGLYALLFAMQPQKAHNEGMSDEYPLEVQERIDALHNFKRWVTHDVLPSIRKTGMYATPATIDNIIANPDMFIQLLQEYKTEKEKNTVLTEQVDQQKQLILDMAPKVEFANSISATETEIGVGDLAKLMKQNGIQIGEIRLYRELRDDGYIMKDSCLPTQYAMERGWFRIVEREVTLPSGRKIATQTTKVTMKGQIDLINKYFDKHIDDIF